MNKNVPKNGQNIATSVKFHETVKLIVSDLIVARALPPPPPPALSKFIVWCLFSDTNLLNNKTLHLH